MLKQETRQKCLVFLFMMALKIAQENCPRYQLPDNLAEELGDGADGQVFAIKNDPNCVCKFSILYQYDEEENILFQFGKVAKVLNYLLKNPSSIHAHVYGYVPLGKFTRNHDGTNFFLYYYKMERLEKLSGDERKVFHSILSHEDQNIEKNFSSEKIRQMLDGMKIGLDFDMEKVMFFCQAIKDSQIVHTDLHPRNIMKDSKGNFKLIDFDRAHLKEA